MSSKPSLAALALVLGVGPSIASAHLELLDPPPRYGRDDLKDGPCGVFGGVRGETVRRYRPGQVIDLEIDEFIDHPSHYRVALDLDGDDDLADPECTANCDDGRLPPPEFVDPEGVLVLGNFVDEDAVLQTITITLPDVSCERCVLQVMQVMYDKRPYEIGGNDNYYRCADIAIGEDGEPDAGVEDAGADDAGPADASVPDAGRADVGSPDMSAADAETRDAGTPDAGTPLDEGGCRASGSGDGTAGWFAVGAMLLLRRRRRSAA